MEDRVNYDWSKDQIIIVIAGVANEATPTIIMKNLKASSHERMRHPMMSELRNKLVHCLLKIELTGELRKGSLCELL